MIGCYLIQEKSARTLVIEYLRGDAVGGAWLGTAPYQTIAAIARGADLEPRVVRQVLRSPTFERAPTRRPPMYRLRAPATRAQVQAAIARVLGEAHEPMTRRALGRAVRRLVLVGAPADLDAALEGMTGTYVRRTDDGQYETQPWRGKGTT